jgi:tetratricopeptide (TPR) repeat protein
LEEETFQRALDEYEKALGPDHISTLAIVHNLGILYYDQGKLKEAEHMRSQAVVRLEDGTPWYIKIRLREH